MTMFNIYEKASGKVLAILPLTLPIGSTVKAYEKAGFIVGWNWSK